jgi:uncharacterized membrane protein HdeD (DUF308 family)
VPEPDPVAHRLAGVGRSPVLLVAEGVLSALLGVLVLTWPGATPPSSPGSSGSS